MNALMINSRAKALALKECEGFYADGYRIVHATDLGSCIVIKLRHLKNGRTLIVKADRREYIVSERGVLLKREVSPI